MKSKIETVREYLRLVETFVTDPKAFEEVLHPEFVHTEYPNLVSPRGQERGFEKCMIGVATGAKILSWQKFEESGFLENGDRLVFEAVWSGEMSVDAGHLKKGKILRAQVCIIAEFRDGKIHRQRNYDCYEPF